MMEKLRLVGEAVREAVDPWSRHRAVVEIADQAAAMREVLVETRKLEKELTEGSAGKKVDKAVDRREKAARALDRETRGN